MADEFWVGFRMLGYCFEYIKVLLGASFIVAKIKYYRFLLMIYFNWLIFKIWQIISFDGLRNLIWFIIITKLIG